MSALRRALRDEDPYRSLVGITAALFDSLDREVDAAERERAIRWGRESARRAEVAAAEVAAYVEDARRERAAEEAEATAGRRANGIGAAERTALEATRAGLALLERAEAGEDVVDEVSSYLALRAELGL